MSEARHYARRVVRREETVKQAAFTLAEVLITLGIIGVVAALTLPTLIQNYQEKARVTALKKVYSVLSNAYNLAIYDNGGSNDFGYTELEYIPGENDELGAPASKGGQENSEKLLNAMKPYLNIQTDCGRDKGEECFSETVEAWYGNELIDIVKMQSRKRRFVVLNDGMSLGFMSTAIYVDINGQKGPNKVGIDIFQFSTAGNTLGFDEDNRLSDLKCYENAFSCAAWVIINENMDYLHCNDLSWNGKTQCK